MLLVALFSIGLFSTQTLSAQVAGDYVLEQDILYIYQTLGGQLVKVRVNDEANLDAISGNTTVESGKAYVWSSGIVTLPDDQPDNVVVTLISATGAWSATTVQVGTSPAGQVIDPLTGANAASVALGSTYSSTLRFWYNSTTDIWTMLGQVTATSQSFSWYDTGVDDIKLYATADPTSWITENSVGDYTVVVPTGESCDKASFIVNTSGGSQNISAGAIILKLDTSADGGNTSIADGTHAVPSGVDGGTGQFKMLTTVLSSGVTLSTTWSAGVATMTMSNITAGYPDGSKMTIAELIPVN